MQCIESRTTLAPTAEGNGIALASQNCSVKCQGEDTLGWNLRALVSVEQVHSW